MQVEHVGVANRSESEAERFYAGVLGLPRLREATVAAPLASQLFGLDAEIRMVVFSGERVKIEVFILPDWSPSALNPAHACLAVVDPAGLLARAAAAGAGVIRAEHQGKVVIFVSDFAGNLFEIKAANPS